MILIEFFNRETCKYTEMVEGWYYYSDSDENIMGGPFATEGEAEDAAASV